MNLQYLQISLKNSISKPELVLSINLMTVLVPNSFFHSEPESELQYRMKLNLNLKNSELSRNCARLKNVFTVSMKAHQEQGIL